MRRHVKPYACTFPNCKQGARRFGTQNDLDRHEKAIHGIGPLSGQSSYRCKARNCEKPDKIWQRFDDFKQHLVRLHRDEHGGDASKIDDIVIR